MRANVKAQIHELLSSQPQGLHYWVYKRLLEHFLSFITTTATLSVFKPNCHKYTVLKRLYTKRRLHIHYFPRWIYWLFGQPHVWYANVMIIILWRMERRRRWADVVQCIHSRVALSCKWWPLYYIPLCSPDFTSPCTNRTGPNRTASKIGNKHEQDGRL